jgi:hypothetical protein
MTSSPIFALFATALSPLLKRSVEVHGLRRPAAPSPAEKLEPGRKVTVKFRSVHAPVVNFRAAAAPR